MSRMQEIYDKLKQEMLEEILIDDDLKPVIDVEGCDPINLDALTTGILLAFVSADICSKSGNNHLSFTIKRMLQHLLDSYKLPLS
jgi:hypothetical protein